MNCLIIAAGHGSRLRAISPSKPLTPVAGVPLIEHVIRAAAAGGASAFTVVTGHEAARLEAFLADADRLSPSAPCASRTGTCPTAIRCSPAPPRIAGDYLLAMSDHLFDPAIVRRLIAAPAAALTLAVDRDLAGPLLDLDDATKVETGAGGAIVRIGKTLDTLSTRSTPACSARRRRWPRRSAAAAAACPKASSGSPTAGRAATMDVTGLRWLDVDDAAALAKAETMLA